MSADANRSTLRGPKARMSLRIIVGCRVHSKGRTRPLDRKSAMRLSWPGMYDASGVIPSCLHHVHRRAARAFRRAEWVPPCLLIYAATVTLSVRMSTAWCRRQGKNDWRDRSTALNSNTLMCGRGPDRGQSPKAVRPIQCPPHP